MKAKTVTSPLHFSQLEAETAQLSRVTSVTSLGGLALFTHATNFSSLVDLSTGQTRRLIGHTKSVWCSALSPTMAATGSHDKQICLFDLSFVSQSQRDSSNTPFLMLSGHTDYVFGLEWGGGSGAFLLSASNDKTFRLWRGLFEGAVFSEPYSAHKAAVNSVAAMRDGAVAVSGSSDQTVKITDLKTKEVVLSWQAQGEPVMAVSSCSWSSSLFAVASGASVTLFDDRQGTAWVSRTSSQDTLTTCQFAGAQVVLFGGMNGSARLWDIRTGSTEVLAKKHARAARSVVPIYEGRAVLSTGDDGKAILHSEPPAPMTRPLAKVKSALSTWSPSIPPEDFENIDLVNKEIAPRLARALLWM